MRCVNLVVRRDRPALSRRATEGLTSDRLHCTPLGEFEMKQDNEFFTTDTTSDHGVELTGIRAYYPYLVGHAFSFREGTRTSALEDMLRLYATSSVQDGAKDRDQWGKLGKRLIESEFCENNWPDGPFGIKRIGSLAKRSDWNDERSICVGFSKAEWKLQRFGDCLGIRPVAIGRSDNELHEEATRTLEELSAQATSRLCFHRFYRLFRVVTPRYSRDYDMAVELSDLRHYMPTIHWIDDAVWMQQELVKDFIGQHREMESGVVVGSYHGLPVTAKLLWDKDTETGDMARRRGTIASGDDSTIRFHGESSGFKMAYAVCSLGGNRCFFSKGIDHDVDYVCEQDVMKNAARVLRNGLVELEHENIVKRNPYWVKMRREFAPATT
ncbi:MAG: hypothetical protein IPJ67_05160 [Candidatus Moraniibacteriota bacterium]|nr:MAG: hypothetical protein IPJ67_05160 [Candidatus Moranbacteria bacterium]